MKLSSCNSHVPLTFAVHWAEAHDMKTASSVREDRGLIGRQGNRNAHTHPFGINGMSSRPGGRSKSLLWVRD